MKDKQQEIHWKLPDGYSKLDDCYLDPLKTPMVLINVGCAHIGNNSQHAYYDEKPQHKIYLQPFLIDLHKVSREHYGQFLENHKETDKISPPTNWERQHRYPNQAVTGINWSEACTYASWQQKQVPTEAQWEVACQLYENRSDGVIIGKGWEWCQDSYVKDFYQNSPELNPACVEDSQYKIIRGEAHYTSLPLSRSSFRYSFPLDHRCTMVGFRCVTNLIKVNSS